MEISHARISSALGVRPTPYVGDCANAETLMSNTNGRTLSIPIVHAPITGDPPRLNAVVQTRHAECGIEGLVPVLSDLCSRRLNLTDFVRAARLELGLLSVPIPHIAEPSMCHSICSPFDLCVVPALAAVGGHLHLLDSAATGPGQPADLVEAAAGQLLCAGRERDDRFGPDLKPQCSDLRFLIEMPVVVVVHVVAVHHLDSPQILGVKDSLEAGDHQP